MLTCKNSIKLVIWTSFSIKLVKRQVLRRWRHRWNKSGEGTALEYHQVTKCLELGKRCQDDKDTGRPSISDIMSHLCEMNCWDKHVISDDKSITGQVNSMIFKCFFLSWTNTYYSVNVNASKETCLFNNGEHLNSVCC